MRSVLGNANSVGCRDAINSAKSRNSPMKQEIQIQACLWTFTLTGEKEQGAIRERKLEFQDSTQITAQPAKTLQS